MITPSNRHFVFIVGTRAQLIKVAPVIVECEKRNFECTLLMTGQHLETMQDMLDEFGVTSPQVFALEAKEHATVLALFSWLPRAYRGIIKKLKELGSSPKNVDVLIHGDTLSTVLGAVAGRRYGARVIHLESGLTSNKILDPFPEEISRRIVFRLSHIAMCPSKETTEHIEKKYPRCSATNTEGNTILDSIRISGVRRKKLPPEKAYYVASLHRFQNIYEKKRFLYLINILEKIAEHRPVHFVLHPATRKRLVKYGFMQRMSENANIKLSPRLAYREFLHLAAESACVLTDGGSNQEELAAIGVPTIIMRQTTERCDGLGSNAIMEEEIKGSVAEFIINRHYDELNQSTCAKFNSSPSKNIVERLLQS